MRKFLVGIILTFFTLIFFPRPVLAGSCFCDNLKVSAYNYTSDSANQCYNGQIYSTGQIPTVVGKKAINSQADCDGSINVGIAGTYTGCSYCTGDACSSGCPTSGLNYQDIACVANADCEKKASNQGVSKCVKQKCWFDRKALEIYQNMTFSGQTVNFTKPKLSISIPGVNFTDAKVDSEGFVNIPFLAEYFVSGYKFAVTAASMLAVIMIILNGFRISMSGGGEEKNVGIQNITKAITGLFIIWSSYALLYTINPNLVQFNILRVKIIKPDYSGVAGTNEQPVYNTSQKCGGFNGDEQTLATDVGLLGDIHKYANYSSIYGPTCKTKVNINAIVLHYTVTNSSASAAGVVKAWATNEFGAICQIIVDNIGLAHQVTNSLDEHVICQGGKTGFNYNSGGIGIEIMGMNTEDLNNNETQKQNVIKLVNNLAAKYSVSKSNDVGNLLSGKGGIFSHEQITRCEKSPYQKIDPGEAYIKQIIEGVSGTYTDWTSDERCKVN